MTHQLTIIGLGNYGLDELPVSIYKLIQQQAKIYVRTKNHPVIAQLEGIAIESFDDVYEAHETFEPVYQAITERLFEYAQHEDIVYAVPGHPAWLRQRHSYCYKMHSNTMWQLKC